MNIQLQNHEQAAPAVIADVAQSSEPIICNVTGARSLGKEYAADAVQPAGIAFVQYLCLTGSLEALTGRLATAPRHRPQDVHW